MKNLPPEIWRLIFSFDSTFIDILRTRVFDEWEKRNRQFHYLEMDEGYTIRNYEEISVQYSNVTLRYVLPPIFQDSKLWEVGGLVIQYIPQLEMLNYLKKKKKKRMVIFALGDQLL